MRRTTVWLFLSAVLLVSSQLVSCASAPVVIPDGLTPMELVQRAQDATDKDQYDVAIQNYQAILDRNPDDIEMVCTAEYEIAFIKYKQHKYTEAKAGFTALLERYKEADAEFLPAQYKILSEKVLAKMELEKK
jgi:outer membrane protein assembly factor BamD (BamD/ComL family)